MNGKETPLTRYSITWVVDLLSTAGALTWQCHFSRFASTSASNFCTNIVGVPEKRVNEYSHKSIINTGTLTDHLQDTSKLQGHFSR